jgi:regulator of protease activity HflC (stomatin/prohibitin superfamily)
MFDRLIDVVIIIWEHLTPLMVIPEYDKGVRLRLGRYHSTLGPGPHWKIPFVDEIITSMVVPTTLNLDEQSVTTKDNKSIVVRCIIKYEVADVKKLLLEVGSASDALADMVQGIIRDKIIMRDWAECNSDGLVGDIQRLSKNEAKRWGINLVSVVITDLSEMRSIRLLNK